MPAWLSRAAAVLLVSAATLCAAQKASPKSEHDPRLDGAYRFERGGWTYVHLQGSPEHIGYQHGYLLSAEIEDTYRVLKLEAEHSTQRKWSFYRDAGRTILWPHIDAEYQQELKGIAAGVAAHGGNLDLWDIVAMNGNIELTEYYVPWLDKQEHADGLRPDDGPEIKAPGNCSAFIATGSYTRDGKIVIAHNNWSSYADGERWTVIFDIQPEHGHRILMDGLPSLITSQDDFAVNDAGIMATETTITQFIGWDSKGIPEFVRSRRALQYSDSIDGYIATMLKGNNGGYANDWLIGDRKTGEIAYLELGLKHTPVWRKKDGYFVSSNFARDPALIRDETDGFDIKDMGSSPNARRVTWESRMAQNKGRIDVEMAEKFLADHEDSFLHEKHADQRSLCGHVDAAKEGVPEWDWAPYYPGGAVQGKAADSDMAGKMSFVARAGHPCGEDFIAKPFLAAHPEYSWQKPILKDMKAGPWTVFKAGETAGR
ncbi:C45 family autoproteolytic acyltransferase/hydolase [Silvibacterium acidisoli]|uniref:C45 family autoproteolytic acyltransferase/hydolase n=1 Tax=Acidobacteriaceae bacterium ZG23-2 TaxID=2883246 RepID=UPI00406C251A